MSGLKKWQNLKIPFADIQHATNNFEKCIGQGGYGRVYAGELSIHEEHTKVAVKRLNEQFGQGLKEFLTEMELLSGQEHENLITLLGYCDEGKEKILVYEYAARGSLDRFIACSNTSSTSLTWMERLRICVGAARGLDHLHNHVGEHQTIIHRDIKSANILIDENWVAKISDLGLSKLCLSGLGRSTIVSYACGTPGYCDPVYISSGTLKKESDVYSFGMVLFEVLCGKLCNVRNEDGFMFSAKVAKDLYEKDKLDEIVDPSLRKQMSPDSMERFSTIAYRCLLDDRKERPPMDHVTKELEELLNLQEEHESKKEQSLKSPAIIVEFDTEEYWKMKLPEDIEDIIKRLDSPPSCSTSKELYALLRKGVTFDHGQRVFSITENGIKCEKLLTKALLKLKERDLLKGRNRGRDSRHRIHDLRDFGSARKGIFPHIKELNIICKINTSTLSLGVMYAARLICSFTMSVHSGGNAMSPNWVWIKWQCQDLRVSSAHFVEEMEYDQNISCLVWKTTLWHFLNNDKNAYFDVVINKILGSNFNDIRYVWIHGIEFLPVDMNKQHNGIEGLEGASTSNEKADWVKIMPDYQRIIDRSENLLLCEGILIDEGRKWLSTCKTGGKCLMLSAIEILSSDTNPEDFDRLSITESRFKEVIRLHHITALSFKFILESDLLSFPKAYSCYLVFKLFDGYNRHQDRCILRASFKMDNTRSEAYAHLQLHEPINIPIVKATKKIKFHDSWNKPKSKGSLVPKRCIDGNDNYFMMKRNDGWMEVVLFKLLSQSDQPFKVNLTCIEGSFYGLIVQGIEFRPM